LHRNLKPDMSWGAQVTVEARGRIERIAAELQRRRFMLRAELRDFLKVWYECYYWGFRGLIMSLRM